jgi:ankyrin repeat protein
LSALTTLLQTTNKQQSSWQLLDEGADLHLVAPKRANGGSPLAEAVAGKHEALVELLLRYGADPFTENRAGKAPLDLALELKAVNILRSFERHALFAGYVNMKASAVELLLCITGMCSTLSKLV